MFFKMVALKILQFHNFIGKHLYGSLFNKVADPQNTTLLKSDSSTGVFLWNLRSFSEYLFFGTSPVAASDSFKFSACNFIKKETPAKIFFCQFGKIFKNIFWQNAYEWLFLMFIFEFWEISRAPLGNCFVHVQVAEF